MSLNKLFTVVEELKNTNSASAKIKILEQYKTDDEIKKYFRYAYDPYYLYGVSSKNLIKNSDMSELEFFNSFFELLDVLRTGKATGNKAIALANGYISQNYNYENLIYEFFDRNLKIGMGVTQINKALGNIIPVFDVALAATYDEDKKAKYGLDNYIIETKCNGLRLITHILYNDGNVVIKSYSRKGKEFTTCKKINEELLYYYKQSKYFGKDLVLSKPVSAVWPVRYGPACAKREYIPGSGWYFPRRSRSKHRRSELCLTCRIFSDASVRRRRSGTLPENKEHCTQQTNPGTEIVPGQLFPHVKNRKGDKYCQRNDFLQDLQLGQIEHGVADTVGRDLQQIFKEGDPPPHHGGNIPGFG